MCITFFHLPGPGEDGPHKLVLFMNRDEFFARPTAPASWSEDGILAGWDLQEGRQGGTWLAMDRRGRIGFLTNIFTGGVNNPVAAGRGFLILDWLRGQLSAQEYLQALSEDTKLYHPFNLVLLEPVMGTYQAWRYTRGKEGHTPSFGPQKETVGCVGVGNHPQGEGSCYRKTVHGRELLEEVVRTGVSGPSLYTSLNSMMSDRACHWPDPQISDQAVCEGKQGPFAEFGEQLSSVFVQVGDDYGTRTTSSVVVDSEGMVVFRETNWGEGMGQPAEITFQIHNS